MFQIPLRPHQVIAKEFIKTRPNSALFLDCGAGKTLSTLTALYELNEPWHVLIVAPLTVAQSTWQNEILKWDFPLRSKSLILNDREKPLTRKARLKLYDEILDHPPTVWFINRDLFDDLIKNLPIRDGHPVWPFGTLVLDELQSFKSYKSVRHKALEKIKPCVFRTIGLTGTPAPNGLMDLWGQIYALDGGARLGKNITAYRKMFFSPALIINNHPVKWEPLPGAEAEIYRRIADITISIDTPGLNLPTCTINDISVKLSPDERKLYQTLLKQKVLTIDDLKIVPGNAGVMFQKLSQMASGALYTGNLDETKTPKDAQKLKSGQEFIKIHNRKTDICEHIVSTTGSPVMIAFWYATDLLALQERFPDGVVFDGSPKMQRDWNNGKIPLAFVQPASCGLGINIQTGPGHTLVWYTLPSNYEVYYQMNKRFYRDGQKNPVTIHRLITAGTTDVITAHSLEQKHMTEQDLINAVKYATN